MRAAQGDLLADTRELEGRTFLIVLNLSHEAPELVLRRPKMRGHVVLNTQLDRENEQVGERIALRGDEGILVLLDDKRLH